MLESLFNLSQFRRREQDFLVTKNRLFLFYGSHLLCKVTTDTPLTSVNVFVCGLVHKLHVEGLLWPLINCLCPLFMVFLHYRSQAADFYVEHQSKPFFK